MTKHNRIKLRLSITLSKADLGLRRIYYEMAAIEGDAALTDEDKADAKRNYLLGILYQYSYATMVPFPSTPATFHNSVAVHSATVAESATATSQYSILRGELSVVDQPFPTIKVPDPNGLDAVSEKALADIGVHFSRVNPTA